MNPENDFELFTESFEEFKQNFSDTLDSIQHEKTNIDIDETINVEENTESLNKNLDEQEKIDKNFKVKKSRETKRTKSTKVKKTMNLRSKICKKLGLSDENELGLWINEEEVLAEIERNEKGSDIEFEESDSEIWDKFCGQDKQYIITNKNKEDSDLINKKNEIEDSKLIKARQLARFEVLREVLWEFSGIYYCWTKDCFQFNEKKNFSLVDYPLSLRFWKTFDVKKRTNELFIDTNIKKYHMVSLELVTDLEVVNRAHEIKFELLKRNKRALKWCEGMDLNDDPSKIRNYYADSLKEIDFYLDVPSVVLVTQKDKRETMKFFKKHFSPEIQAQVMRSIESYNDSGISPYLIERQKCDIDPSDELSEIINQKINLFASQTISSPQKLKNSTINDFFQPKKTEKFLNQRNSTIEQLHETNHFEPIDQKINTNDQNIVDKLGEINKTDETSSEATEEYQDERVNLNQETLVDERNYQDLTGKGHQQQKSINFKNTQKFEFNKKYDNSHTNFKNNANSQSKTKTEQLAELKELFNNQ